MSGHWPPEWDDPDDNIPGEAGEPDAEAEAALSAVAAYLASVPAPLMPGSVEARISAALAVEAASRAGLGARTDGTAQADSAAQADSTARAQQAAPTPTADEPRVLRPVPGTRARARAQARVRRRGARWQQRGGRRPLGQLVLGPLAVIVLLVVIGFGLSRISSSSSSSSSGVSSGAVAAPASSAAASGGEYAAAGSSAASAPRAASPGAVAGVSGGFVVSATGTTYQQATLAQQAQAQLRAARARAVPSSAAPASSSSSAVPSPSTPPVRTFAPSPQLRACVLKVTGGVLPELVDQATYQGTPVYVIASSSRVWVVGQGCTATRPQVIASLPLAG
jgi:hypothetical protein